MNDVELKRGAERLRKPEVIGFMLVCSFVMALMMAAWGITAGLVFLLIPLSVFFVSMIFFNPRNGLIAVYTLNFFALGIYRYINVVPWGLTVDILLVLTYLGLFFHTFHRKVAWGNAANELTLIALIWFGYSIMELVNPEAGSRVAWFYAVRGISLYMLLTIPLIFIIFAKQ